MNDEVKLMQLGHAEVTGVGGMRALTLYVSDRNSYHVHLSEWDEVLQSAHWDESEGEEDQLVYERLEPNGRQWITAETLKNLEMQLNYNHDLHGGAFGQLFGPAAMAYEPLQKALDEEDMDLSSYQDK